MEIVTTPTLGWISNQAQQCVSRILVGCPYVNEAAVQIFDLVPSEVADRTLVTRADKYDFALGASNLESLFTLAQKGVTLYKLPALHAKVYVIDDAVALVTSANATNAGMRSNLECGLTTDDSEKVKELARLLMSGFDVTEPRKLAVTDLEELKERVEEIKKSLPDVPSDQNIIGNSRVFEAAYTFPDDEDVPAGPTETVHEHLLIGLTGQRLLAMRGVLQMSKNGFDMDMLFAKCAQEIESRYRSRDPRATLRRVLQELRDVGLVEFVDNNGWYRLKHR